MDIKNFECEEDLSQYTDSMLYDSDTTIAHIECAAADGTSVEMDLMVRGHVKVEYNGCTYKTPSDFPERLKKLIRKFPNKWDLHRNIFISENNWFEYIYTVTQNGESYSDGIMFEKDLSKYSVEDLREEMLELCGNIIKNLGAQSTQFCPWCYQPLAEDGRCYNDKCKAYDPISQYFDEPSEEDIAKDIEALNKRLEEENNSGSAAVTDNETIF